MFSAKCPKACLSVGVADAEAIDCSLSRLRRQGGNMGDIYANLSNLSATDHLGRKLPGYDTAGDKKEGKIVGLFYYLWLLYHGTQGPYDITKILEAQPDAMEHPESPVWPPAEHTPMLHWGEPLFGYYVSQDPWVLRRHVQMFIDAGIDVLFFDVTNGFTYRKSYLALFEILREYMNRGFKAPKVCFYTAPGIRGCGTGNLMDLWEQLYEPRLYPELYFYWNGKPLMICHSMRSLPDEVRDFFTWRSPTWGVPQAPNTWAWGTEQKVAIDEDGRPEEIAVSVCRVAYGSDKDYGFRGMGDAAYGVPMIGRSWHDGAKDTRENASHYGFQFEEQAQTALNSDAPVAFVTQWNEWLVPFLTRETNTLYPMDDYPIRLQDEFNEEYSRDLEPMKGGYKDAYYMHLISFVRRFKGMDKPIAETQMHSIDISRDFSKWDDVALAYREYTGDVAPRSFKAYDAIGRYENYTGRNEFKRLKVAYDGESLCFFAEFVNNVVFSGGKPIRLFLNTRGSSHARWSEYDFMAEINATGNAELYRCAENDHFAWEKLSPAECGIFENKLHIKASAKALGIANNDFEFEFKWSDNMQENDVMDFYQNGDAAPRGRLNYLYIFSKGK